MQVVPEEPGGAPRIRAASIREQEGQRRIIFGPDEHAANEIVDHRAESLPQRRRDPGSLVEVGDPPLPRRVVEKPRRPLHQHQPGETLLPRNVHESEADGVPERPPDQHDAAQLEVLKQLGDILAVPRDPVAVSDPE